MYHTVMRRSVLESVHLITKAAHYHASWALLKVNLKKCMGPVACMHEYQKVVWFISS